MKSRLEVKSGPICSIYKWKSVACEICKHPYKFKTLINHDILSYNVPEDNYIVLEQISKSSESKAIFVVSLDKDLIRIGWGKELEIRISDISVSRFHSCLWIENKKVLIFDNNSKFGTLIMIQNPLNISQFKSVTL